MRVSADLRVNEPSKRAVDEETNKGQHADTDEKGRSAAKATSLECGDRDDNERGECDPTVKAVDISRAPKTRGRRRKVPVSPDGSEGNSPSAVAKAVPPMRKSARNASKKNKGGVVP